MIEIDILPASTKSKGGDSILVRVHRQRENSQYEQKIVLIDGGYLENTSRIKQYLTEYYGSNRIDHVIISHPDKDHIIGFRDLLHDDQIDIGQAYIHDPWEYIPHIKRKEGDDRRTNVSVGKALEETISNLSETLDLLDEKKIKNKQPFAGLSIDLFDYKLVVLGPDEGFYKGLLEDFGVFSDQGSGKQSEIYTDKEFPFRDLSKYFLEAPETSNRNSSSVISVILDKNSKPLVLLTADSGVLALGRAINYAESKNINLSGIPIMQIPHHGSLKNISEDLIRKISPKKSFVSAPPENWNHPSKILLNYLHIKMNTKVRWIKDKFGIRFTFNNPPVRNGWETVKEFTPFENVPKIKE